jgi:hypothetical protein
VNYQLVRSAEEDLTRPVLPEFAAQGALNGDRLEREILQAGWHIAAAQLACHHEDFPA